MNDITVKLKPDESNPLWNYFKSNTGRLIHKWQHYFDIYNNHFNRFRNKSITVMEIGVYHGGSLQMWKKYFGPQANIIGIDIDPRCMKLLEDQITIEIGDQANREFLRKIIKKYGPIDIIIDDGGHFMDQQIISFEELFPALKEDGIYLVEDLHTSYWSEYGGGYQTPGSFIEYSKKLIDKLNARHSRDCRLSVDNFTKSVTGLHFYDSVFVVEKQPEIAHILSTTTGYISF